MKMDTTAWKTNKINVAIQVLPEANGKIKYELVDKAIEAIQSMGYNYHVCPFETVVECTYLQLPELLETVHNSCRKAGTEKMLTNIKIQVNFSDNVTINDKMEKYT